MPEDDTSEADFLRKADRIALLAQKLTHGIDELAEIGSAFILRPLRKDGLTSAEKPDEFYAQVRAGQNHQLPIASLTITLSESC